MTVKDVNTDVICEKQRRFHKVNEIIQNYEAKKENLIAILQRVQEEYRYLPEEMLTYIAITMNLSPASVYGVATFYSQFSLNPKGKYEIKVCDGTACHVRKSMPVLNAIKQKLNLTGEKITTDDLKFSIETVSCLGACGLAPVVVINEKVYPQMTPAAIAVIIDKLQQE
ncbi:MAG: NAD(P)H-dependent oxidoreductase subunit E [Candidatus Gastranaerophilales bacterium]|nr:NAD(P)H-dependent oxidoreductase subunit E [Candidatus Gastranaerophilales bacterium]